MADTARCALTTLQTTKSSGINHCPADAGVWLAYGCAKAIAGCHADCFVGQSQIDKRERRGMKPVADVWSRKRFSLASSMGEEHVWSELLYTSIVL